MKAITIILPVIIVMVISALAMIATSQIILTKQQNQNICHQQIIVGTECELTLHDAYGYDIGYPFIYGKAGGFEGQTINVRNIAIDYLIWLAGTILLALPIYKFGPSLISKIKQK